MYAQLLLTLSISIGGLFLLVALTVLASALWDALHGQRSFTRPASLRCLAAPSRGRTAVRSIAWGALALRRHGQASAVRWQRFAPKWWEQ